MAEGMGVYSQSGSPEIQEYTVTAAQTFAKGAVLVFSSGTVSEGGANPTDIVGVAMGAASSGPGYDAANSPSPITWREDLISVAKAEADRNIFVSPMCNNTLTSTKISPAATDVGVQYGIVKQTSGASAGQWWVDKNLTTSNARVEIVKVDIGNQLVHFKFLVEHTTLE